MKILVFCENNLILDGFEAVYVYDNDQFFTKILDKKFDVIIVSVNFFGDYLEIKRFVKSFVIFVNEFCDGQIYKKVLEVADFCYTYQEYYKLNTRLKYLQKKILNTSSSVFKFKEFLYNFKIKELYKKNENIKLSQAQKELLEILIKNRNRYLSKDEIVNRSESIESEQSIKVLISHLRKYGIEIENQKNMGYKLKI